MTELSSRTTLTYLINYIPGNDIERINYEKLDMSVLSYYLRESQSNILSGFFYLGGQLKMKLDEEITLAKIAEARQITSQRLYEYGGPTNSWEMSSITSSENLLEQMEKIIQFHLTLPLLIESENLNRI